MSVLQVILPAASVNGVFRGFNSVAVSFSSFPLSFVFGAVLLEVTSLSVLVVIGELSLVVVPVNVESMSPSVTKVVCPVARVNLSVLSNEDSKTVSEAALILTLISRAVVLVPVNSSAWISFSGLYFSDTVVSNALVFRSS